MFLKTPKEIGNTLVCTARRPPGNKWAVRHLVTRGDAVPVGSSLHRTGMRPEKRVDFPVFSIRRSSRLCICLCDLLLGRIYSHLKARRCRGTNAVMPRRQRGDVEAQSTRRQLFVATLVLYLDFTGGLCLSQLPSAGNF